MGNQLTNSDTIRPCTGLTKSGKQCKNYAMTGSNFCRIHQPELPNQKTAEPSSTESYEQVMPNAEQRRRLLIELEALIERVRELTPEYQAPPFSPQRLLQLIGQKMMPGWVPTLSSPMAYTLAGEPLLQRELL